MRKLAVLMLLGGLVAFASAADKPAELKPVMTETGKQLLSEDLTSPLSKEWKTAKGKWEVVDGAIRGSELKEDMHGAVSRHEVAFQNGIVQFSFKLDGAKAISLSMNGAKGHLCRALIRPNGFTIQKDDQDGKKGDDKPAPIATCETPIKPGEWHTIVVEMQGKEMLAIMDGKFFAYGSNDSIDKPKANIGLTVAGESASFKNLKVWEATPSKDWEKAREKYKK